MNKLILALSFVIGAGIIAGCNKTESTPLPAGAAASGGAPPSAPTQSQAIANNSKIPPEAKRGILGGGSPGAGK